MALPRKNRLQGKKEIKSVFRGGRSLSGRFINIKVVNTGDDSLKIMIIVPMRISEKSSKRNYLRRKISEAIRKLLPKTKIRYIVAITLKDQSFSSEDELLNDALTLWAKSGMLKQ